MQIVFAENIAEDDYREYVHDAACGLLAHTRMLFVISEDNQMIGYVGVMGESMLSTQVYLWIALGRSKLGLQKLRQVRSLGHEFLSRLNADVFAEASVYSTKDNKFLSYLGFEQIGHYQDRNVYRWTN